MSLANGVRFQMLKTLRNEAVKGTNKGDWEDQQEADASAAPNKYNTESFTVEVKVGNTPVTMLCPAKRYNVADPMILLDAGMIAAVLSYIRPDLGEASATRAYTKSGKYQKTARG